MGFFTLFDAAVYGGRPARHPPGRCCATFKSAPGEFVLLRRALTDRPQIKQKARSFDRAFRFYLMPGSSLLSHGETPHYHRRYGVSLLSSAWGQVGPPRYSRQANSVIRPLMRSDVICIKLNVVSSPKHLRRCKVKPHGSLVSVSSMYRYTYTPDLSTSSSLTFLQET